MRDQWAPATGLLLRRYGLTPDRLSSMTGHELEALDADLAAHLRALEKQARDARRRTGG